MSYEVDREPLQAHVLNEYASHLTTHELESGSRDCWDREPLEGAIAQNVDRKN